MNFREIFALFVPFHLVPYRPTRKRSAGLILPVKLLLYLYLTLVASHVRIKELYIY